MSCDKPSKDTEEERQRIDSGGGEAEQEMENTELSDEKRGDEQRKGERNIGGKSKKKGADARTVVPGQSQALRHHTSIPPACHLALSFTHTQKNTTMQP